MESFRLARLAKRYKYSTYGRRNRPSAPHAGYPSSRVVCRARTLERLPLLAQGALAPYLDDAPERRCVMRLIDCWMPRAPCATERRDASVGRAVSAFGNEHAGSPARDVRRGSRRIANLFFLPPRSVMQSYKVGVWVPTTSALPKLLRTPSTSIQCRASRQSASASNHPHQPSRSTSTGAAASRSSRRLGIFQSKSALVPHDHA